MPQKVLFVFDVEHDAHRVGQIGDMPTVVVKKLLSDETQWARIRTKGDQTVQKLMDKAIDQTTATVVLIGGHTDKKDYVRCCIRETIRKGHPLVGIQIHHLEDEQGRVDNPGPKPARIKSSGFNVYKYVNAAALVQRIEEAARTLRQM